MKTHIWAPVLAEEAAHLVIWHAEMAALASATAVAREHERSAARWEKELRYWASHGQPEAHPDPAGAVHLTLPGMENDV